ncbi:ly6/PLAUR domain-containing protein 6B-like isoform X1 [Conger conger]|uniref:ly6/PLAUR domain-containing protein 6B-like isoform X1 n=2 Tax=Conger conger TaxID=82655 RepID=UPI002A599967|nr:ly6/PLAUR domain-containing protein 6B-like isoform X1 [Conger conger]
MGATCSGSKVNGQRSGDKTARPGPGKGCVVRDHRPVVMAFSVVLRHTTLLQVLLVAAMSDERNVNHINFYNIVPPADVTPFPKSFKCYTCEHAVDNYSCNRWAEDKWCPENTQFCMTVHHFTGHGKTKSVTKRCVSRADCYSVGCQHHRDAEHMECISCCEGMACNVEVPTNHSTAVFSMRHTPNDSASSDWAWRVPMLLATVFTVTVVL